MPCGVHDLQGIFITENISGASVPPIDSDGPASERAEFPKIPPEIDGVQVNFCKNPSCANYGVPSGLKKGAHRSKAAASTPGTEYRLTAKSRGGVGSATSMQCLLCGESFPLKSNLGIAEEIARLSSYLWDKREPSCPNPACLNPAYPVDCQSCDRANPLGAVERFVNRRRDLCRKAESGVTRRH